jgi:RNA polymerase sigma-70 factor (ECF subfamily)
MAKRTATDPTACGSRLQATRGRASGYLPLRVNLRGGLCVGRVDVAGRMDALDDQTIRAFLREEAPRLVAALTLIAGSREAAEDAMQEALARAWDRSERGEEIRSLGAWVTTVALNHARNAARRGRFDLRLLGRLGRSPGVAAPTGDRVDLGRALSQLPVRQREVTVLHYYLDMDVRTVADTLGVHEGTVKTSLHRARAALAATLSADETEEVTHDGRR